MWRERAREGTHTERARERERERERERDWYFRTHTHYPPPNPPPLRPPSLPPWRQRTPKEGLALPEIDFALPMKNGITIVQVEQEYTLVRRKTDGIKPFLPTPQLKTCKVSHYKDLLV